MVLVFVKKYQMYQNRQIQLLSILFLIMIIIITNQILEKYKTELKNILVLQFGGFQFLFFMGAEL